MKQHTQTLPTRTLGELLNETFAVYGRHLWAFIGLAAVVQVPISLLAHFLGNGPTAYGVEGALRFFGWFLVYGAVAFAVGQQYVTGRITIGQCYMRVRWRILSMTLLSLILAVSILLGAALAVLIVPAIVMFAALVYWSMAVPAIIVQGYKPVDALKRSFGLVRGSWWRVFGITVVIMLVVLGLAIVITIPFAIASWLAAPDGPTVVSNTVQLLGDLTVAAAVLPVAAVASTLLYYDLRVRKEDYSLISLSQEMGIATA